MLKIILQSGEKRWLRRKIRLYMLFFICIFLYSDYVYAGEPELPKEVVKVANESKMISKLFKGMKEHQSYFAFYYPGIGKDFTKYQKQSSCYKTFMDKLSVKNGYLTGIVSGYCITICGEKKQYVTFQFGYLTTKNQEKKINKKVKQIVRKIGKGSRVVRAKKAHDYLIRHMQYDETYYNPYYAFFKGRGICMSYALAYQRILQEMKIPCIYVKGNNHAWNMVKIGCYWYNVDVTWDDSEGGNRYFLKADRDFPNHEQMNPGEMCSLRKAKYSYKVTVK